MSTVALGFSGGVDSAVSAVLLKKEGYDVRGVYLDNTDKAARKDAEEGAETVGIPLQIIDVHEDLEQHVCTPFCEAYLRGETPNPCILCNPVLKFRNLLDAGCDRIATGHYARAVSGAIFKGHPDNDQSYMLCRLTPEQAARLILPLGEYPKREVRALAEQFGLPVAKKPDSMEICFIPDKDYISWLEARSPGCSRRSGNVVFHGNVVGTHSGICRWTVGQRYPGLIDGRKVYISRIHAEINEIELSLWEELFTRDVYARDFSALCSMPSDFEGSIKVRHTKWENPSCRVHVENGMLHAVCDELVRAPAPGQSAVIYCGDRLIGGGFIV